MLSPWEEKLFTPKKHPLLFGKKAQQLEDVHEKSTAFLAGCEIQPRKFTEKFFAHFPISVLQKFHPKKNPSKFTYQNQPKNGHCKKQPPIGTHQLLWTQKTGRPCNSWTSQAIWSPTSSWWIRFLGEPQFVHPKKTQQEFWRKTLWGLVWFDWLELWLVGWSRWWLSPPIGLVQVVWLWWSCNLQGLFGPAKDGQGMEMDDRTWVKGISGGVKKLHGLVLLALPRKLKPRNFGTSFLCPPISI